MSDFVRELERVYPTTVLSLRRAACEDLIVQFESFLDTELAGVNEPARWLPLYLKTRAVPPVILQASEWEWAHFICQAVDFGRRPLDPDQVHINSSMQFIELHDRVPDLGKEPGLYGIFRTRSGVQHRFFPLAEALIMESLHEDRKFTKQQLAEYAAMEAEEWPGLRGVPWSEVIDDMIRAGVLESRS